MRGITNDKITESKPIEIKRNPFVEIQALKEKLAETDYIACKIAEGSATTEEYADIIADRQRWREEINSLESELKNNGI